MTGLNEALDPYPFLVEYQFHSPDMVWAAAFHRDGKPWILDGALVGVGPTRETALDDLIGIARHLVMYAENHLSNGTITLDDRTWLFRVLDHGPESDDEMYAALRSAGGKI